eukprot:CAMPEP_0176410548 /NCGR_PEP_ID=MMETSP0127-20121128/3117_1 /TAXON_ID=938130 /ORGANISM="Platyophrya macrostoma, Strain WH" /LENGTH=36 /DNA_ID= /DNA_START= /DNA_END= /DNA_ORIENTATION=
MDHAFSKGKTRKSVPHASGSELTPYDRYVQPSHGVP